MQEDPLQNWAVRHAVGDDALGALRSVLSDPTWGAASAPAWMQADPEPLAVSSAPLSVLGVLGRGGMGEVLRVHDPELDRVVAAKTIRSELVDRPSAVARFLREARATAALQHPGIVPVYALGALPDGRPCFLMREIVGRTLGELMAEPGPATRRRVLGVLHRVAETMAYAHARGVTHRDLKPDNVMIGAFGDVLVVDWGLQRGAAVAGAGATRADVVAGTPRYMAPEQARGEPAGPPSDVYALGLMIWETLVGRPARASGPDLLDRAAAGTIPEVDLADDTLAALLSDVLQPAPEARPADASTVADELGAWLRGEASRDRATAHVAAALAERPALAALLAAAEDARRDAATLAASTPSHARRAAREALWAAEDAAREADVARDRALRAHVLRLEAALAEHPGLPEARQALADHYRARVEEAEAAGRDASADLHRVAQYDDGVHAAWLQGDGCLTLHTARPGATVVARPLEERGRRRVPGDSTPLGTTPLEAVALPRGSWLLELSHPGRPTVRYPVTLDRCEHWDGVGPDGHVHAVACPDALSVDEVFVPAGWFQRGRRHAVRGDYSPWERTWVDDWVVQRFCVTNADYLAFLDDLVVRGEEARALQHVPRTREGAPPLYGRTDDGCFCLVPDDDGDLWDLRWPVILVTWHDAAAYAAWRAERDGLPWQLLPETVWEKAGRGVDGRLYAWGDRPEPSFANARGSRPGRPMLETVDAYPEDVSIYGVRGLHGGVREWSADLASADGAGREERRIKGGCWFFDAGTGSLPYRYALMAKLRGDTIGFRIGRPL